MRRRGNYISPTMVAYIIFLLICMLAKFITEFPMWERLISGVIVASYFFSLSTVFSTYIELHELYRSPADELCRRINRVQYVINQKYDSLFGGQTKESQQAANIKDRLSSGKNEIKKIQKSAQGFGRGRGVLGVLYYCCMSAGYLLVLSMISFETFAGFFVSFQEKLTLGAFIVILVCEMVKEWFYISADRKIYKLNERTGALETEMDKLSEENGL